MSYLLILIYLLTLACAPAPSLRAATDEPLQIKTKFRPEPLARVRGEDR